MRAFIVTPMCALLALLMNGCSARSAPLPLTEPLSRIEIEQVAAPIALYPDPLLQRVLTASTFPDQILDAALFIDRGGAPSEIPQKPWERSVKYVANYPSILAFLADDIDNTIRLGAAFTDSPDELRECIQALRRRAREHGNLKSSSYQTVIEEGAPGPTQTIRIEPTNPDVIYTPTTTTTTVIYERPLDDVASLWAPLASFGLGVAIATAFDHDDFYYYGGPFYGPGFWYGGPMYRRWYDYRHDRWHHAYDYGRWHHTEPHHREEWAQHRHDLDRKHSEWRDTHRGRIGGHHTGGPSPEGRASFRPRSTPPRGVDAHHPPSRGRAGSDLSSRPSHPTHHGGGHDGRGFSGHGGRGSAGHGGGGRGR